MNVNLKTFLLTGEFGSVRFGMTRQQLKEILGMPDGWGAQDDKWRANIWKYGSFEFYFPDLKYVDNPGLYMIFTDDFGLPLHGNQDLVIDPWLLNGQLNLSTMEATLKYEQIVYNRSDRMDNHPSAQLTFPSGVLLTFSVHIMSNDESKPVLQAITFKDPQQQYVRDLTKQISVVLPLALYEKIRRISLKRKQSITSICSEWLVNHINQSSED